MKPLVEPGPALTPDQTARYARHLTLPEVGPEGQRRLRNARVLVIGAGGLGSPALLYLTAAGVGHITVIDDDVVDLTNLQRQVLHRTADIGRPKAESAREALLELDPQASVTPLAERLSADNALDLFADHDLVLDGTDNFGTRYLSNDACELTGTPLVWGSIFRFQGQVSVFWPAQGPTLRDLFPDIPPPDAVPSCAEGGVFGILPAVIGATMAAEAIKLICGIGEPLVGRVLVHDTLRAEQRILKLVRDPDRSPVTSLAEAQAACSPGPGPSERSQMDTITVEELTTRRANEGDRAPLVLDVREDWERDIVAIPDTVWVPMGTILEGGWDAIADQLPGATDGREVVVHCKSGKRSADTIEALQSSAPAQVKFSNLTGGVLAWAEQNDAPTY